MNQFAWHSKVLCGQRRSCRFILFLTSSSNDQTGEIMSTELLNDLQPWGHLASWRSLIRKPSAMFTLSRSLGNFHNSQKESTSIICPSLSVRHFHLYFISPSQRFCEVVSVNSMTEVKLREGKKCAPAGTASEGRHRNPRPALRTKRPCPLSLPPPHGLSFLSTFWDTGKRSELTKKKKRFPFTPILNSQQGFWPL